MTGFGRHRLRRRSRSVVALTVLLCAALVNVQPAQAEPVPGSGVTRAGEADPAKRPDTAFEPGVKLPGTQVIPGTDEKIAPLRTEMTPTEPKALAGANTGAGLSFPGGSSEKTGADARNYVCTPFITGSVYTGNDPTIGPFSDTYYTAGVQCNFWLEYMYGVSGAIDRTQYYDGEIGYVGSAFQGSGSAGTSAGAFEVQGDLYDGGRQIELIVELVMVASAPWAACDPIPGLRYLACDGLGTYQLHVVLGTGAYNTGLAPPVIRYVALGDSYSAGNGAPHSLDVPTAPDCRRSLQAYSFGIYRGLLPGDRGQPVPIDLPTHKACSGARFDHYNRTQPGAEREQRGWLSPQRTRLVTITLGGNDLGFTDRLTACFTGDCSGAPLLSTVDVDTMRLSLSILYGDIRRNMRADGRLVVLSYPAVLPNPDDPGDWQKNSGNCLLVDAALSNAELRRIWEAASTINSMIQQAVSWANDPRVQFVDALNAFRGHRVCAPSDQQWAAGITIPTTSDTFHPNPLGYGAMAGQIRQQIGIR